MKGRTNTTRDKQKRKKNKSAFCEPIANIL